MTLEQYIRQEHANGTIDFRFRAHVVDGRVEIYIHPLNRDGLTTPTLIVTGDCVQPRVWATASEPAAVQTYRAVPTAGYVAPALAPNADAGGDVVIFGDAVVFMPAGAGK